MIQGRQLAHKQRRILLIKQGEVLWKREKPLLGQLGPTYKFITKEWLKAKTVSLQRTEVQIECTLIQWIFRSVSPPMYREMRVLWAVIRYLRAHWWSSQTNLGRTPNLGQTRTFARPISPSAITMTNFAPRIKRIWMLMACRFSWHRKTAEMSSKPACPRLSSASEIRRKTKAWAKQRRYTLLRIELPSQDRALTP